MKSGEQKQTTSLLPKVIGVLEKSERPYAVIGAMALAYHGVIRASLDLDLILFEGTKYAPALIRDFQAAGLEAELRTPDGSDPILGLILVSDRHKNRIDILLGLRGLDAGARKRVVSAPYEGLKLNIIGAEDLAAMKLFAGGPQDLEDVRRLLATLGSKMSKVLLRRLAKSFGQETQSQLKKLLSEAS